MAQEEEPTTPLQYAVMAVKVSFGTLRSDGAGGQRAPVQIGETYARNGR